MKKVIQMIVVLTVIGLVSGGVLSRINSWANPFIVANKKAATERAIFLVQPEGKTYEAIENPNFEAYKVSDKDGNFLGYALVYEGNGFQGKIRLMVGVKKDLKTLTALEILEQVETPGLGTRVTEKPFRNQFKGLTSVPMINWVKGTPPTQPNEIQAITGATISSKSVVAIVNAGLEELRKAEGGAQ